MMSAFMFPIYLAKNKIQKTTEREREKIQKAQLKAEKLGTKRGPCQALTDQRERQN